MCVVIDLDAVCLICLQPSKEMQSVFATDVDSSELQIAQKISILSELKIDQNKHNLPSKICAKCLQDLKAAWRFRNNCQAAVTIFHTIVSLDEEQPEEGDVSKEPEEKHTRAPQGLQIKHVEQTIGKMSEEIKKAPLEEYVIVNDKGSSSLYEEFETHEYVCHQEEEEELKQEFTSLEEVVVKSADIGQHEEEDENSLVEYYINEEGGIAEELSIKVEKDPTISNLTGKQINSQRPNEQKDSEPTKITALLLKINKPIPRGRPKSNRTQLQNSKKGSGKIKKPDVSNANSPHISEVRPVKSRRRKAVSPDTKSPKICEICGNSYRFQHALNAHMRRHYNDKPFPCEVCDKAFVSNVELRRHIRVHTGQKPYACQYCDRRFSDFGSRIKHERTHTGERPYACSTCGKSFAYPHVLSVHLHTHTGEKRFRCDHCSAGFTKKAYLQRHVEQYHSDVNNYENMNDEATNSSQEKSILGTEYMNEDALEDNAEYEEDESQADNGKVIITSSRIQFRNEDTNDADDDNENANEENIHEIVEVLPDEYTIRVR